jgi:sugar O-acyltransferase (sialic acid O-acetyltransferase NeuD family)
MVVADIIRLRDELEIAGFLDDVNPARAGETFFGARVLGGREQLERLHDQGVHKMIVAFGHSPARLSIGALVRSRGYELVAAVHPRAVVAAGVRVSAGTVIKPGAAIDPDVTMGELAIVGSNVCVGHGCALQDGARISGGSCLAGSVEVGRATWLGVGVTVKDRVRIGERVVIGAGAVVVTDIPDGVVAYGVPARVRREATPDDH